MASPTQRPKLLVIVGPTASGKSELALKVAKTYRGEIIAADSRTIYKGLDIGTAKPSIAEQAAVPHWGLDLVEPSQTYSAKRFKDYALGKIKDIQARDKLPILVGGTGLYVDAVVFEFGFRPSPALAERQTLDVLGLSELQHITKKLSYQMPANPKNRRHLIRNIERKGRAGTQKPMASSTLLVGIIPSDETLKRRINDRANKMFDTGVVQETSWLAQRYGRQVASGTAGIVYGICLQLIEGKVDMEQAKDLFKRADWQYARRQKTWFKRNEHIKWFDDIYSAQRYIQDSLNT